MASAKKCDRCEKFFEFGEINSIEDIATEMRVLANYIGGDHLTNKEAEVELHTLANILSGYNIRINTLADDCVKAIMQTTGSDMTERRGKKDGADRETT